MVKGDAEKRRERIAEAFTKKYKVGDIAFCPLYGKMELIKINDKTAVGIQINERGNPILYGGKVSPITVQKYLFSV
jgi:hypothetical protein